MKSTYSTVGICLMTSTYIKYLANDLFLRYVCMWMETSTYIMCVEDELYFHNVHGC